MSFHGDSTVPYNSLQVYSVFSDRCMVCCPLALFPILYPSVANFWCPLQISFFDLCVGAQQMNASLTVGVVEIYCQEMLQKL